MLSECYFYMLQQHQLIYLPNYHRHGGSEPRKPEKLWVDRGSEFYNKTFKSLLKEYGTGKAASGIELYSTYLFIYYV